MGRINGMEDMEQIPAKVAAMYEAVGEMIMEGLDVPDMRVSMITERAGIGKGTAYEYFDTKEEIIVCSLVYHMRKMSAEFEAAMEQFDSFRERLKAMLKNCESEEAKGQYFIRFVHVITNNSVFGHLVRRKMSELGVETPIVSVFSRILREGMERGEIRSDLPLDYAVCTLFARLLAYTVHKCEPQLLQMDSVRMRELIYQGIEEEFAADGLRESSRTMTLE